MKDMTQMESLACSQKLVFGMGVERSVSPKVETEYENILKAQEAEFRLPDIR
jgi:hypothetical protein